MKCLRLFKLISLCLCIMILFSGCMALGGESAGNKRLVSAIGFDRSGEEITVLLETAEAKGDGKVTPRVLKQTGGDIRSVATIIEAESPRKLDFGYISVVAFGETLSREQRKEIFEFLRGRNEIPLSVITVSTNNVFDTLSFKNEEGESSGQEISKIIEQSQKKLGIASNSALYEIEAERLKDSHIYGLPHVELNDGRLSLIGTSVFSNDEHLSNLDYEQTVVFTMLRNLFDGGEIIYKNKVYTVSSQETDVSCSLKGDKLIIDITVKAGDHTDDVVKIIKKGLEDRKSDVFGIKGLIRNKKPDIWAKIESVYDKYYQNADINVVGE